MDASQLLALLPAQYSVYLLAAGGVCALVSAALPAPTPAAPAWWAVAYRAINVVGGNFGAAKNHDDVMARQAVPNQQAVPTGARAVLPWLLLAAFAGLLSACSPAQEATAQKALASPTGKLFCEVQMNGGGSIVVGVIDATAGPAAGAAGPAVVLAAGATKAFVDKECADAAAAVPNAVAGSGAPVRDPPQPAAVPNVVVGR